MDWPLQSTDSGRNHACITRNDSPLGCIILCVWSVTAILYIFKYVCYNQNVVCSCVLQLTFNIIESHLLRLTLVGTGLLLGTALGVIIPEYVTSPPSWSFIDVCRGIEALVEAQIDPKLLSSRVALSLLFGFTSMLVVEQFVSPHSHSSSDVPAVPLHNHDTSNVEFDAELGELERQEGISRPGYVQVDGNPRSAVVVGAKARAYPLTFGLVIHSLADGLALGVSLFPSNEDDSSRLSLIVFLAIMVHKGDLSMLSLITTRVIHPIRTFSAYIFSFDDFAAGHITSSA